MNKNEQKFRTCVIVCAIVSSIVIMLSLIFLRKHICSDQKKPREQASVPSDGGDKQPYEREVIVCFKGEKESIQPGIVIDILNITTNLVYEEEFTTNSALTYIIRNESRDDIFILLQPPPITLAWVEITTGNEIIQIDYPIVCHGPAPQPVDAVFFSGYRAWRSSKSYSFLKIFSQIIPSSSLKDLPIEQEPGSFYKKDFTNEHFVKGLLRASFDITYYVVGGNEMKTQRIEKTIIVKSTKEETNGQSKGGLE